MSLLQKSKTNFLLKDKEGTLYLHMLWTLASYFYLFHITVINVISALIRLNKYNRGWCTATSQNEWRMTLK